VICGERVATARDHLPPRGIFPKPRPADLLTVPCCQECNVAASKWDERFRVYLSLHIARHESGWRSVLDEQVLPSVNHNERLRREILASAESVLLRTPAGIDLGPAVKIDWDSEAHDRVVERVIRGLHFHHTGEILGGAAVVHVQFLEELRAAAAAFEDEPLHSLAGGQFMYKGIFHEELPLRSAWVLEFRGWKWSSGYVEPRGPSDGGVPNKRIERTPPALS